MAYNCGLLWSIVAYCFGLLGVPGKLHAPPYARASTNGAELGVTAFHRGTATMQIPQKLSHVPGRPVDHNHGLLGIYYGLLWRIVAYYFGLLGFPGEH